MIRGFRTAPIILRRSPAGNIVSIGGTMGRTEAPCELAVEHIRIAAGREPVERDMHLEILALVARIDALKLRRSASGTCSRSRISAAERASSANAAAISGQVFGWTGVIRVFARSKLRSE